MIEKRRGLGLGHFLNTASQEASQEEHKLDGVAKVQLIDIKDLKFNPKNFYGLRDIDELAHQIELSQVVEPLSVEHNPESGKEGEPPYLILAGHRRYSAWKKLLDEGKVTETTLPCIVRTFKPWKIGETTIDPERIAEAYLMYSNMGQRKNLTVDEQIQEVEHLEPLARELFATKPEGKRGNFRTFFANEILGIPETVLQRRLSLRKLIPSVKEAIDQGVLSITCGAELGSLDSETQESYLGAVKEGTCKGTIEEIRQFKRNQRKAETSEPEEPAETDEPPAPDDDREPEEPIEPSTPSHHEAEEPAEPAMDDSDEPDEPIEPSGDEDEEPAEEPVSPEEAEKPAVSPNPELTITVAAVPKRFTDPQKEANDWVASEQKKTLEGLLQYAEAQSRAYADTDKLVASQWNMRASALQVKILMLDEVLL